MKLLYSNYRANNESLTNDESARTTFGSLSGSKERSKKGGG